MADLLCRLHHHVGDFFLLPRWGKAKRGAADADGGDDMVIGISDEGRHIDDSQLKLFPCPGVLFVFGVRDGFAQLFRVT